MPVSYTLGFVGATGGGAPNTTAAAGAPGDMRPAILPEIALAVLLHRPPLLQGRARTAEFPPRSQGRDSSHSTWSSTNSIG